MADSVGIDDALQQLIDCLCLGLEDAGAPVCTCGTTIGEPLVTTCCGCGDGGVGELWGSLVRVYRRGTSFGPTPYPERGIVRPCQPAEWVAEFRVQLFRCFPTIDSKGRLPAPEKVAAAATALHADVATVERAIRCCALPEPAFASSIQVLNDPQAGCSSLTLSVMVPVSLAADKNLRP